jgi:hypothetical protein
MFTNIGRESTTFCVKFTFVAASIHLVEGRR